MEIIALQRSHSDYPERLATIDGPPRELYCLGAPLTELLKHPTVAIVGSRQISSYGKQVAYDFALGLAEQGVVIISGLAYGVDAMAHEATMSAGGLAIAVLPTPVDRIYPAGHQPLAQEILDNGGAIISEYVVNEWANKQNFVARNRIVTGLADALVIIEAAEKSGTLHTAKFALDQGKHVFAVPGPITSPVSIGTNNLLKAGKAGVATSYKDVLHQLGFLYHRTKRQKVVGRNQHEQTILNLMLQGIQDGDTLLEGSGLNASDYNKALTMLEIGNKIRPLGANQWAIW